MIRLALVVALLLLAVTPADATAPRPAPDPTALLHPVDVSGAGERASDPTRTGAPSLKSRAMGESGSAAPVSPGQALASHPAILPAPSPAVAAPGSTSPTGRRPDDPRPTPPGASMPAPVIGVASWYPGSRGWHGVPHIALPSGRWTGQIGAHAAVCVFEGGRSRCATLPVVDCLCGGIPGRIVDLSIEAVALLGLDPARGLWRASVEVLR